MDFSALLWTFLLKMQNYTLFIVFFRLHLSFEYNIQSEKMKFNILRKTLEKFSFAGYIIRQTKSTENHGEKKLCQKVFQLHLFSASFSLVPPERQNVPSKTIPGSPFSATRSPSRARDGKQVTLILSSVSLLRTRSKSFP